MDFSLDRRVLLKQFSAALALSGLTINAKAGEPIGNQAAFANALRDKPWLLGFLGSAQTEFRAKVENLYGKLPDALRGQLFRNGPAFHNIGQDRFMNWLDAPGMTQKFTFSDEGISHHARIINTKRNTTEWNAQRIEFDGFGTYASPLSTGGSADGQSVANINFVHHANELLALWEGGSPHIIDPLTLKTEGLKSWSNTTKGLPFGAHPQIDEDGSMWNIGYSVQPNFLLIYHISANGELLKINPIPQISTPMVHDFMITRTKLIIVAPPFRASVMGDKSFLEAFEWQQKDHVQVLVFDKNDLSKVTQIEVEPFWVFHFGNAYDLNANEIGFDFALHENPQFMTTDAFRIMDGSWDGKASANSSYARARLDLNAQRANVERISDFGQVEFIQTDRRDHFNEHRFSLLLSQPAGQNGFWFNRIVLVDKQTGNATSFQMQDTEILEEHIIVTKRTGDTGFWIMGTSLDWGKGRTSLNVYDGEDLAGGPVLKAELDRALPLGLHGIFINQIED